MRETIEAAGASSSICAYSPISIIEMAFSKLKALLRKAQSKPSRYGQIGELIDASHKNANYLNDWTSCLIPGFDGAIFSMEWKDALWDQPEDRRQMEEADIRLISRSGRE